MPPPHSHLQDRYPGYGNFRDYRRRVAAETSAFTRCLRCFLRGASDEPQLEVELRRLGFAPDEVKGYMAAGNKQIYALEKLGETARCYGMREQDRARFDTTISVLCDNVGACERIFKTPHGTPPSLRDTVPWFGRRARGGGRGRGFLERAG